MSKLYESIKDLCDNRGITGYRMCKDLGLQPSLMTDLKMGRKSSMKAETASAIAEYFGVSVDRLITGEQKETPVETDERTVNDDDIKLALFGGDGEVTDEMWDEALFAVQLIKERHKREKEKNGRPLSDR